jgi:hypothetical protein
MKNERKKLEAIIEHNGDEKYIVAKVGDNGTSKLVLVSLPLEYHSGIKSAYERAVGKRVEVLGGGLLEIDREAKRIKTYGKSGGFGKPDISVVKEILKASFPNYAIDAKVTDYIRD